MWSTTVSLCLCLTVGISHEWIIDNFEYSSSAEARNIWRAVKGTPPVNVTVVEGKPVLEFQAPFASNPRLERTILDRDVTLDLSGVGSLVLEVNVNNSEVTPRLSLYFRSGGGWFAAGSLLAPLNWQTVIFRPSDFATEGNPSGWHAIDGVRISIWRPAEQDFTVRLRKLVAKWHDVALILPTPSAGAENELQSARRFVSQMSTLLDELGVPFDLVEDRAIAAGGLKRQRLAILAYHPALPEDATTGLERFLDHGGKLFACYILPGRLANRLGIRKLSYWRPDTPLLGEVRFEPGQIPGLPPAFHQASWNINEPVVGQEAKIIGFWFDRNGNPTGKAAATVSSAGSYFSHVLLEEDRPRKLQFLAAVLGHLHPRLWPAMAAEGIHRARAVGHLKNPEETEAFLNNLANRVPSELLADYRALLSKAQEHYDRGEYPFALDTAAGARGKLVALYAHGMPSRTFEGRAFWNHSGTGAYPGDWDRTARELAEAGFNMVLPNMLWGGLAHFASETLPQSSTYRQFGDQIHQCVKACHKHGIEVHVWKVNWNLSTAPPEFVARMRAENRLQKNFRGQEHNWLCPSHPDNFRLEVESMLEVVRKYEVDGIHFDYIRYPSGEYCYCEGCRSRFETVIGRPVSNWPQEVREGSLREPYLDFRVDQISRLVSTVATEVRRLKPRVKISAAVFGWYPDCRSSVGQDWVAWVRAGYLDFVCPMDYSQDDRTFSHLVESQLRFVENRIPVYPGIGAWQLPPDRVLGQIFLVRELQAPGFTIFNLTEDQAANLLPLIKAGVGAAKASPPHRSR
jgi:uncharacterized lipoprotein YddW (UPF0748 family)